MKPKILVLSSSFPKYKGDINGNFVYELCSRLINDFEIHVLVPFYKGALKFEEIEGIKIHRHKQSIFNKTELAYGIGIYENLKKNKLKYLVLPFYFFYLIISLIKIINKEKINICHAHWLIPNAFIAVLFKKVFCHDLKILTTIHGSDLWGFDNALGNYLKKYTLKNINDLTVVSQPIKQRVISLGYKKEVYIYPMGVDTKLFSPGQKDDSLKKKLNINGFLLLFVGVVVEQKGIRFLIEAMPLILKKFPDTKLLVVGEGNLKNEMIELSKTLNISENIIFTGAISHVNLPPYFATADLFVLPSFSEGWPVVVMEALSSEAITVVSNIDTFTKHKEKEKLFNIVETGNANDIANCVNIILADKELILSKKAYLRKYAVEYFDWENIAAKYSLLIRNCMKR